MKLSSVSLALAATFPTSQAFSANTQSSVLNKISPFHSGQHQQNNPDRPDGRLNGLSQSRLLNPNKSIQLTALRATNEDRFSSEASAQSQGMSASNPRGSKRIAQECMDLIDDCERMTFAAINPQKPQPEQSLVQFVSDRQPLAFYILISPIQKGSESLMAAADRQQSISVSFAEPETHHPKPFASKRANFQTQASRVAPGSDEWHKQVDKMRHKFGADIVDSLLQLGDFSLMKLTPTEGRFVKGFGQAYDLVGDMSEARHATGSQGGHRGHQRPSSDDTH